MESFATDEDEGDSSAEQFAAQVLSPTDAFWGAELPLSPHHDTPALHPPQGQGGAQQDAFTHSQHSQQEQYARLGSPLGQEGRPCQEYGHSGQQGHTSQPGHHLQGLQQTLSYQQDQHGGNVDQGQHGQQSQQGQHGGNADRGQHGQQGQQGQHNHQGQWPLTLVRPGWRLDAVHQVIPGSGGGLGQCRAGLAESLEQYDEATQLMVVQILASAGRGLAPTAQGKGGGRGLAEEQGQGQGQGQVHGQRREQEATGVLVAPTPVPHDSSGEATSLMHQILAAQVSSQPGTQPGLGAATWGREGAGGASGRPNLQSGAHDSKAASVQQQHTLLQQMLMAQAASEGLGRPLQEPEAFRGQTTGFGEGGMSGLGSQGQQEFEASDQRVLATGEVGVGEGSQDAMCWEPSDPGYAHASPLESPNQALSGGDSYGALGIPGTVDQQESAPAGTGYYAGGWFDEPASLPESGALDAFVEPGQPPQSSALLLLKQVLGQASQRASQSQQGQYSRALEEQSHIQPHKPVVHQGQHLGGGGGGRGSETWNVVQGYNPASNKPVTGIPVSVTSLGPSQPDPVTGSSMAASVTGSLAQLPVVGSRFAAASGQAPIDGAMTVEDEQALSHLVQRLLSAPREAMPPGDEDGAPGGGPMVSLPRELCSAAASVSFSPMGQSDGSTPLSPLQRSDGSIPLSPMGHSDASAPVSPLRAGEGPGAGTGSASVSVSPLAKLMAHVSCLSNPTSPSHGGEQRYAGSARNARATGAAAASHGTAAGAALGAVAGPEAGAVLGGGLAVDAMAQREGRRKIAAATAAAGGGVGGGGAGGVVQGGEAPVGEAVYNTQRAYLHGSMASPVPSKSPRRALAPPEGAPSRPSPATKIRILSAGADPGSTSGTPAGAKGVIPRAPVQKAGTKVGLGHTSYLGGATQKSPEQNSISHYSIPSQYNSTSQHHPKGSPKGLASGAILGSPGGPSSGDFPLSPAGGATGSGGIPGVVPASGCPSSGAIFCPSPGTLPGLESQGTSTTSSPGGMTLVALGRTSAAQSAASSPGSGAFGSPPFGVPAPGASATPGASLPASPLSASGAPKPPLGVAAGGAPGTMVSAAGLPGTGIPGASPGAGGMAARPQSPLLRLPRMVPIPLPPHGMPQAVGSQQGASSAKTVQRYQGFQGQQGGATTGMGGLGQPLAPSAGSPQGMAPGVAPGLASGSGSGAALAYDCGPAFGPSAGPGSGFMTGSGAGNASAPGVSGALPPRGAGYAVRQPGHKQQASGLLSQELRGAATPPGGAGSPGHTVGAPGAGPTSPLSPVPAGSPVSPEGARSPWGNKSPGVGDSVSPTGAAGGALSPGSVNRGFSSLLHTGTASGGGAGSSSGSGRLVPLPVGSPAGEPYPQLRSLGARRQLGLGAEGPGGPGAIRQTRKSRTEARLRGGRRAPDSRAMDLDSEGVRPTYGVPAGGSPLSSKLAASCPDLSAGSGALNAFLEELAASPLRSPGLLRSTLFSDQLQGDTGGLPPGTIPGGHEGVFGGQSTGFHPTSPLGTPGPISEGSPLRATANRFAGTGTPGGVPGGVPTVQGSPRNESSPSGQAHASAGVSTSGLAGGMNLDPPGATSRAPGPSALQQRRRWGGAGRSIAEAVPRQDAYLGQPGATPGAPQASGVPGTPLPGAPPEQSPGVSPQGMGPLHLASLRKGSWGLSSSAPTLWEALRSDP